MFVFWRVVDVQKDFADSDTAIQQRDDDKSSFLCTVLCKFQLYSWTFPRVPNRSYNVSIHHPQGLIDTPGAG